MSRYDRPHLNTPVLRRPKMKRVELADHVRAIQRAVEAKLPEDEPDCVQRWVYETAVRVMADRIAGGGQHG